MNGKKKNINIQILFCGVNGRIKHIKQKFNILNRPLPEQNASLNNTCEAVITTQSRIFISPFFDAQFMRSNGLEISPLISLVSQRLKERMGEEERTLESLIVHDM